MFRRQNLTDLVYIKDLLDMFKSLRFHNKCKPHNTRPLNMLLIEHPHSIFQRVCGNLFFGTMFRTPVVVSMNYPRN